MDNSKGGQGGEQRGTVAWFLLDPGEVQIKTVGVSSYSPGTAGREPENQRAGLEKGVSGDGD